MEADWPIHAGGQIGACMYRRTQRADGEDQWQFICLRSPNRRAGKRITIESCESCEVLKTQPWRVARGVAPPISARLKRQMEADDAATRPYWDESGRPILVKMPIPRLDENGKMVSKKGQADS